MKDTEYAYAVARVRALENTLLDSRITEQLISAGSKKEIIRILSDKGWDFSENEDNAEKTLNTMANDAWQFLTDTVPNPDEIKFLTVNNDFHNIKAALKAYVSKDDAPDSFLYPTTLDTENLKTVFADKSYHLLPEYIAEPAKAAYSAITRTIDGQLCDIILDKGAMEALNKLAKQTGNSWIIEYAELCTAVADIKIAIRASRQGKPMQFLDDAICECNGIGTNALKLAAAKGLDETLNYLSSTVYGDISEAYKVSAAYFEKICDDRIMQQIQSAKLQSFGIEPVIAFYLARIAEIRQVRIILLCHGIGADKKIIEERMRELYV